MSGRPTTSYEKLRRRFAALAIVAALARALVPVGFMPVMVDGTPKLMFCDGHAAVGAHHVHGGMPHHEHAGGAKSADGPCVFALSAGAAPLPVVLAGTVPVTAADAFAPRSDQSTFTSPPRRHAAPRGPPAVA
jgi:hypothetical protein